MFSRDDAAAVRHGWQIDVGPGGLIRTYRDPRFDRFARCATSGEADPECPQRPDTGRALADRTQPDM
jgi:hypothetical protein